MALGDFMGCFVVVALFHTLMGVLRNMRNNAHID
jgi:hypothetical protein